MFKKILIAIFTFLFFNNCLADAQIILDQAHEQRAQKLFMMVKCPTCMGQPIKESETEIAKTLRNEIRQKILENLNDNEILDYIGAKYGQQIILKPKIDFINIWLWFIPFAIFAIGITLVLIKFTKYDTDKEFN